jgi:hypothetical protein
VVAIVVAVLVAYFPALGRGFTNWDDDRFITHNPLFHGPVSAYVAAALTRVQFQAYHPLHLLSYLPDRLLWPLCGPWGSMPESGAVRAGPGAGLFPLAPERGVLPAAGRDPAGGLASAGRRIGGVGVGRKDVLALCCWFRDLAGRGSRGARTRGRRWRPACWPRWLAWPRPRRWCCPLSCSRGSTSRARSRLRLALRRCLPFAIIALVFALPVPLHLEAQPDDSVQPAAALRARRAWHLRRVRQPRDRARGSGAGLSPP